MSQRPGTTGQQPTLVIDNITRSFETKQVLDGVNMTIFPGQIHGLIGPNGAGKTTILRTISGLVNPETGRVYVDGHDTTGPVDVRQFVGLVPSSDRSFYLRLTALDNLVFFGRLGGLPRRAAREAALTRLADVGLAKEAKTRVGAFSHGMHKRLCLARALMHEPALLLIDEATHDLDPANAQRVLALVNQAAADGAAVLWTTQRLEELRGFASTVTVLVSGRPLFDGTVHDLAAQADIRRFVVRFSSPPSALLQHGAAAIPGVGTVTSSPELGESHVHLVLEESATLGEAIGHLTALVKPAGLTVLSCSEQTSSIESAFLGLVDS